MKRYTPEQIVQVLREAEISRSQETTEEFCRRKGISTVSYYLYWLLTGSECARFHKRCQNLPAKSAFLYLDTDKGK
jgi:hypothetical protein